MPLLRYRSMIYPAIALMATYAPLLLSQCQQSLNHYNKTYAVSLANKMLECMPQPSFRMMVYWWSFPMTLPNSSVASHSLLYWATPTVRKRRINQHISVHLDWLTHVYLLEGVLFEAKDIWVEAPLKHIDWSSAGHFKLQDSGYWWVSSMRELTDPALQGEQWLVTLDSPS